MRIVEIWRKLSILRQHPLALDTDTPLIVLWIRLASVAIVQKLLWPFLSKQHVKKTDICGDYVCNSTMKRRHGLRCLNCSSCSAVVAKKWKIAKRQRTSSAFVSSFLETSKISVREINAVSDISTGSVEKIVPAQLLNSD